MLESLCTNIELAAGALANKRMVKVSNKINDFVSKRSNKERYRSRGETLQSDGSEEGLAMGAEGSSTAKGRVKDTLGTGNAVNTTLEEAREQAEILKTELERVQSGVHLLGHSVEKLNDVVRVDTRCCGGLMDLFSVGGYGGGYGGGMTATRIGNGRSNGYDLVAYSERDVTYAADSGVISDARKGLSQTPSATMLLADGGHGHGEEAGPENDADPGNSA
jgi:hypothetical protein